MLELMNFSTTAIAYRFLNGDMKIIGEPSQNTTVSYAKAVILDKTIDYLRAVAEKSQNQMEVRLLLDMQQVSWGRRLPS